MITFNLFNNITNGNNFFTYMVAKGSVFIGRSCSRVRRDQEHHADVSHVQGREPRLETSRPGAPVIFRLLRRTHAGPWRLAGTTSQGPRRVVRANSRSAGRARCLCYFFLRNPMVGQKSQSFCHWEVFQDSQILRWYERQATYPEWWDMIKSSWGEPQLQRFGTIDIWVI